MTVDWPAWVQAIGSIIAIGVAIYVPGKIRKDEAKETERRENEQNRRDATQKEAAAAYLFVGLSELKQDAEDTTKNLATVARSQDANEVIAKERYLILQVPAEIKVGVETTYLFDTTIARRTAQALGLAYSYNRRLKNELEQARESPTAPELCKSLLGLQESTKAVAQILGSVIPYYQALCHSDDTIPAELGTHPVSGLAE